MPLPALPPPVPAIVTKHQLSHEMHLCPVCDECNMRFRILVIAYTSMRKSLHFKKVMFYKISAHDCWDCGSKHGLVLRIDGVLHCYDCMLRKAKQCQSTPGPL